MFKYILKIEKVLLILIAMVAISPKGNAKGGDTTYLPYAKVPHYHTLQEIADGLENGTLQLNMPISEYVKSRTDLLNFYREQQQWKDANGYLIDTIKPDVHLIAEVFRNSSLKPANWQNDQALVGRYEIVKDKKGNVIKSGFGSWSRLAYSGENLIWFDPSNKNGIVGNHQPICLGSHWCLNDVFIKNSQNQNQNQNQNNFQIPNNYQQQYQQPNFNLNQQFAQQGNYAPGNDYVTLQTLHWLDIGTMHGYAERDFPQITTIPVNYGSGNYGYNPYGYSLTGGLIGLGVTALSAWLFSPKQQPTNVYVQNNASVGVNGNGISTTWTPPVNTAGTGSNNGGVTITGGSYQGSSFVGNVIKLFQGLGHK